MYFQHALHKDKSAEGSWILGNEKAELTYNSHALTLKQSDYYHNT